MTRAPLSGPWRSAAPWERFDLFKVNALSKILNKLTSGVQPHIVFDIEKSTIIRSNLE